MKIRSAESSSGQILLLVLLGMAVVLVVALSIVSRSLVDISLTTLDEDSQRAFSAAEAGISKALITGSDLSEAIGNASFSVDVDTLSAGVSAVHPDELVSGESIIFWFVPQNTEGALDCSAGNCFEGNKFKICWSNDSSINDFTPAIEASIFYDAIPGGDYSDVKVVRVTGDANQFARPVDNNFSNVDSGACSITIEGLTTDFKFQKLIDLPVITGIADGPGAFYNQQNGLQFMRVKLFYTSQPQQIGFSTQNLPGGSSCNRLNGNCSLPPQGLRIESTGVSGDASRKVEVFQTYGEPPWIFEGVFSESDIIK